MKHTPGPWIAWRNSCYWEISAKNANPKKFSFDIGNVCSSAPGDRDGGLQEANARLIAAAPELLRALHHIVEMNPELPMGMIEAAEDAIAKARGEA